MSFSMSRIDKRQRTYTVADNLGGTYTTVDVALLPVRSAPTAATVWTSVPFADGEATVVWAGPDANPSGAIVVPATADAWIKGTDAPYVQAVLVERIDIKDSSGATLPAILPTPDSLVAALLNDPTSATYARVVALITARTGFGAGA